MKVFGPNAASTLLCVMATVCQMCDGQHSVTARPGETVTARPGETVTARPGETVTARPGETVTARPGETITLPCRAPDHRPFIAVQWTRPDLTPDLVLFFMGRNTHPKQQHPSFHDRVDLVQKQKNESNVSLILRNATSNDSGTYECRVQWEGGRRVIRGVVQSPPINTVTLTVQESGHSAAKEANHGLIAALSAGGVVVVVVVVILILLAVVMYKRRRGRSPRILYTTAQTEHVGDKTTL